MSISESSVSAGIASACWPVNLSLEGVRAADQPDAVRSVINGSNNDPRDRVLTVLMIVWRFRNNLFHGEKWAYQLEGQLGNFTHANSVLMRLLERTAN